MNYPYFTDEANLIRETVAKFCRTEAAPHAETWDEPGEFPREMFSKAGELGLFGIRFPTNLGGSELDWWSSTAAIEALAEADSGSFAMAMLVQSESSTPNC